MYLNENKRIMVLSSRSLENLIGVHPDLALVMTEAIKDSPQDFTIVEGVRTVKRQRELYAKGRSIPGKIVTNADGVRNKSNHQTKADGYGHAVDIYPFHEGKVRVSEPYVKTMLATITDHIKSTANRLNIEIECGIDWKRPYDPPHIQLKQK